MCAFFLCRVSGMCKHVAALLYHVVDQVRQGRNQACTSLLQKWHKPASLKTSGFLSDVITPKASNRVCPEMKARRDEFDPRPVSCRTVRTLADFDLNSLDALSQGCSAVLLYANKFRDPSVPENAIPNLMDVHSTVTVETTVPVLPIVATFTQHRPSSPTAFLKLLRCNDLGRDALEQATRNQTDSTEWVKQRAGRMTASVMHNVISHVGDNDAITGVVKSLVERIMGYTPSFTSAPTTHGKIGEKYVRQRYKKVQAKKHSNLKVSLSGLWVFEDYPVIGASPDGIVSCSCCPTRLLEIKCPYKYRLLTVREYAAQGTSTTKRRHATEIIVVNDNIIVNIKHQYYTQIQTQLMCTGLQNCDLAIGTMSENENFANFRIARNDKFCEMIQKKASVFFHKIIFPELHSQKFLKERQEKERSKTLIT